MSKWLEAADPSGELRMRVSWGEKDSRPLPPGSSSGGGKLAPPSVVVLRGRPVVRASSSTLRGSRLRVSEKFQSRVALPVQPRCEGERWNSSDEEEDALTGKEELMSVVTESLRAAPGG